MMRLAASVAACFLVSSFEVLARCVYVPLQLAEIHVEACAPIENERNLLVIGKVVAFITIDDRSAAPLSVTRVDGWEANPSERFVWTQSDQGVKDCGFIERKEPLLVRLEQPCCDVHDYAVQPDGTSRRVGNLSCLENLREISEIEYKSLPEDAHNNSLKRTP